MMVEALVAVESAKNSKTPTKLKDLMLDVDEKPPRTKSAAEIKAMLMLALGGPKPSAAPARPSPAASEPPGQ